VDAAALVADGAPVDWVSAESAAEADHRRLVRHLRLVESIASLHRSIPLAEPDDFELPAARSRQATGAGPAGPHWGRLALLDRIGQGTSCEVYRAWDTALHREVALKLLHDEGDHVEAHGRLLEEARRLARVRHAHVVQVYGAEQHEGRVGLWMELVRGESLEHTVHSRGTFGAREAALIGLDLCAALAAVHGAGLLHRDVKAQNVMRESGGRLVLMDFGTGEELSGTNRLVGTPLYLAPEIFRGQRASVQSDIYSLAVLLFYLVSGRFPVNAGSMEELARAHGRRERQLLRDLRPDLPEAFVASVERALDSDPTRRFQSVGDFESALRESLDVPSGRVAAHAPVARRRRFGFAFMAAAAVLVAIIAGLIVWTGFPSRAPSSVTSLAILPIVHPSAATSELSDALTDQLIATIGQIDSLRTTSMASTRPFKGVDMPSGEIASRLGVDAVLEGVLSVVDGSAGGPGRLRVDATLRAGTGAKLWSGYAVRNRGESAALLSEIARNVARAVRVPVTAEERARLRQVRRTNPAAEEAYLQGRVQLSGFGPEPAQRALAAFQRAATLDPNYGEAHAGAALAYLKLGAFSVLSHPDARLSARAEIRKAFESGEDIAEAHAAEADVKFLYDWDWDGAERDYLRSLDLNPGLIQARNNYAQVLAARGRSDESLRISEETLRMDPESIDALISHGVLLYYKRDFTAAQAVSDRAVAQEPGNPAAHFLQSRVAEAQGRYDDALAAAGQASELSGTPGVNVRVATIRLQALSGRKDDALAAAAALLKAGQRGTVRVRPRDRAYLYLGLGQTQAALDAFAEAFDERDPTLVWLPVEPRVDVLRNAPRFQALLQQLAE